MPTALRPRTVLAAAVSLLITLVLAACSSDLPTSAVVRPADRTGVVSGAESDGGFDTPPLWEKRPDRGRGHRRPQIEDQDHGGADDPHGKQDRRYVVAELEPGADLEAILDLTRGKLVAEIPEISTVKLRGLGKPNPEAFLTAVREAPGVVSAVFEQRVEASEARGMTVSFNDGFLLRSDVEGQTFLDRLHVPEALLISRGAGIRIAVLDTGVDPSHPDLAAQLRGGWDQVGDDDAPWDIADGIDEDEDGLVDEAYGHGTHVAGILSLLAPEAEILVYRVLDDEGWGDASGVAQAVVRAVQDGADVINLSLGMYDEFKALENAINLAVKNDVLVVAAVGNDGAMVPAQYPALYATVLSAGSADSRDALAAFSSYGPHLDVTAPGVDVLSLYPGGGYACWSGSSMSTAIVSALGALVMEHNPGFSVLQVQRKIVAGVAPDTGIPGTTGYGRVDFLETLR